MIRYLIDTSVLVKWFHTEGETEVEAARALRDAHAADEHEALVLDLALYETGNVLLRALRWSAQDISDQLRDLLAIVGPALAMEPAWLDAAAAIGDEHRLTFYDASWAAAAAELEVPLVSADRQLLAAGLAVSPTDAVRRLGLR